MRAVVESMALIKHAPTSALAVSPQARRRARLWLESPEYEASMRLRILSGTLPPAVEVMMWHYAYGKAAENVEVNVTVSEGDRAAIQRESDEQLQARVSQAVQALAEVRKREEEEARAEEAKFAENVQKAAAIAQKMAKGHSNFIPDAELVLEGEYRREDGKSF